LEERQGLLNGQARYPAGRLVWGGMKSVSQNETQTAQQANVINGIDSID
jgi:hypothetical protein